MHTQHIKETTEAELLTMLYETGQGIYHTSYGLEEQANLNGAGVGLLCAIRAMAQHVENTVEKLMQLHQKKKEAI